MFYRLRTDFQLAIISLFGACAVFGILPLAVYRFVSGQVLVGVLDVLVVTGIAGGVAYAWRSGDTRRCGLVLVFVTTVGATAVAMLLGVDGVFWLYPTFLANFFLVGRRLAVTLTMGAILVLVSHGGAFQSQAQSFSFLLSASVVSLLALIFAARTETQRFQLETLATRDSLTGVENRRAMEHELQMAVHTNLRNPAPYGLVMLDLDHFKRINDQYGHDAGDRVLVVFADLMRKSTRKVDRLFRFGGEEFVLLLPGAGVAELDTATSHLMDRIRAELKSPSGAVTCSMGAAALLPGEEWPLWLARADAAMYRAKQGGRNRVEIDQGEHPPGPASGEVALQ